MPQMSAAPNPPPLPGAQPRMSQAGAPPVPSARARQLFIIFNGQKIPVTKEEFVIGRGSKSADLAIKDGNISRRHAAVVLHNGAHYIKDLGSTNGVEYQGRRFDSKRIEEGDVFRICDYELRFTYQ
jgi:neural Wiskott-Aldrich syndrome protein